MDKNECEDKYSEAETEEHLNGKRDLFEWIKKQNGVTNAVLEGWIPETKQRPDIMFEYEDKKYVIEYQCSPIASQYIERHELYQAVGINDIWICGTEKYFQKYHNGTGTKRINLLEGESKTYYNPNDNFFYFAATELDRITKLNYKKIQCLLNDKIDLIRTSSTYIIFQKNISIDRTLFESIEKCIVDYDDNTEKNILLYLSKIRKYYPLFNIEEKRKNHTVYINLYDKTENDILICSIAINMCYYNNSIEIIDCRGIGNRIHRNIKAINFLINYVYKNRKDYIAIYKYKENRDCRINTITSIANKLSSYKEINNYTCNFKSYYYDYGIILESDVQDFAVFIKSYKIDFCKRQKNGYWKNIDSREYDSEDDIFNTDIFSSIVKTFELTEVKDN